jgi:hypothetical protein
VHAGLEGSFWRKLEGLTWEWRKSKLEVGEVAFVVLTCFLVASCTVRSSRKTATSTSVIEVEV